MAKQINMKNCNFYNLHTIKTCLRTSKIDHFCEVYIRYYRFFLNIIIDLKKKIIFPEIGSTDQSKTSKHR